MSLAIISKDKVEIDNNSHHVIYLEEKAYVMVQVCERVGRLLKEKSQANIDSCEECENGCVFNFILTHKK